MSGSKIHLIRRRQWQSTIAVPMASCWTTRTSPPASGIETF
jgi:hypothetical protein